MRGKHELDCKPTVNLFGFLSAKTCFCRTWGLNQIKPVKNGENQNAGIIGWYKEFLFTAAAVYCLKILVFYKN